MGKSQTLKRKGGVLSHSKRVICWDNNKDHLYQDTPQRRENKRHGYRENMAFDNLGHFFRMLKKADMSGKGYRIAYIGEAAPDLFEDWAKGVWSVLDGRNLTDLLIEEYSDCCRGPGLLSATRERYHRRLWTQSRKYGGILTATTQRPQLISNDSIGNAAEMWAGSMDFPAAKRIAGEIGCSRDEIIELDVGQFFHWKGGRNFQKHQVFIPKST